MSPAAIVRAVDHILGRWSSWLRATATQKRCQTALLILLDHYLYSIQYHDIFYTWIMENMEGHSFSSSSTFINLVRLTNTFSSSHSGSYCRFQDDICNWFSWATLRCDQKKIFFLQAPSLHDSHRLGPKWTLWKIILWNRTSWRGGGRTSLALVRMSYIGALDLLLIRALVNMYDVTKPLPWPTFALNTRVTVTPYVVLWVSFLNVCYDAKCRTKSRSVMFNVSPLYSV